MSMIDAIPLLAGAGADGGYQISRSVRTRSSASAYFNRTFSTPTLSTKWTWSGWVKRGTLGAAQTLFSGQVDVNNWGIIAFLAGDTLSFQQADAGSVTSTVTTTQVFRDPSAWYHIVVVFDSTQATAANRLKMYVNGVQVTAFGTATYLAQNTASRINAAVAHQLSRYISAAQYFDGYLTEINFIDGQALTPSSFGETNAVTGVWQPKAYAGTYGTNGFYLPFSDNSGADSFGIGADKSADALNRVELGNTSVGYTILGTMTFASAGAAQVHLRDNNSSTAAADPGGLTTNTALGYDFGRAIKIRRIATLTAAANGTGATSIFNIQYSDDNVTWTTVTGSATTHTFSAGLAQSNTTDIDDNGSHRYWRLRYLSGTTAGNFWIATLDMYVNNIGPNSWFPVNVSTTAGVTYDSMLDVPTLYADGGNGRGNYAVLNPLWVGSGITTSNANLTATASSSANSLALGTIAVSSGKWYWESTIVSGSSMWAGGVVNPSIATPNYTSLTTGNSYAYNNASTSYNGQTGTTYGATYTTNDVIGTALDLDTGAITFYKNGVSQGVAYTGISGTFTPMVLLNTSSISINFGQRPFAYTPPTGFVALNTQNLPTPTISNGANYMAASLYTGTGASQTVSNAVNSISFQPDWIWIKSRSAAGSHSLYDVNRGVRDGLFTNVTSAENTEAAGYSMTAFNSNGFTVGLENAGSGSVNANGTTYVGWNWKGGGTAVTNTAGSITSSVSANTTAGFSVVTYTGTGANATVGHGLGVAPKMVIVKQRTGTAQQWVIWHTALLGTEYLGFDTAAKNTLANVWNSTIPTNSVFSIGPNGSSGANTINYVAYCFAEVAGYSAFGKYTGNGSTDGPFVFLGFRPRFCLIKRTDSTGNWFIWDSSRNTSNTVNNQLYPDSSSAEQVQDGIDFLSNGFKIRFSSTFADRNANGGTYIYAAFAEVPFRNSLAR